MNSNNKRFPPSFRPTFGILKKNGEKYKDIIGAFIVQRIISLEDLRRGVLRPSPTEDAYLIHTDYETFQQISKANTADCVISFQRRKNGNFALIRLYKTSLSSSYIRKETT